MGSLWCAQCNMNLGRVRRHDTGMIDDLPQFVNVYLLAEKLGCLVLRDELNSHLEHINFLCDGPYTFPKPELLQRAYLETNPDSPLRNAIVEFAVRSFFEVPVDEIAIPALQRNCDEFADVYLREIEQHILRGKCGFITCKVHGREEYKRNWL